VETQIILNYMIISRTPFRISFAGGGTDFREFYREEGGAVVSTTIDKYVYLSINPLFNNKGYHLKYFYNEICKDIEQIKHPIIKEVFERYHISGVDFNSTTDVPSGTGLGSSSSFTVGLVNLCKNYCDMTVFRDYIAEEASEVEIDILKSPIGKQDQYAATFGGLNFIRFKPDESVDIFPIILSKDKLKELESSLVLFYLGGTRSSDSVLTEQKNNILSNRGTLKKMALLTVDLANELNNDTINNFGDILNAGWRYKKELSSNVSNGDIDYWYNEAMKHGAKGGKLLGAGNGGFLLLYAPNGGADILRASLRLYELNFKFENTGTKIIYQ